jgi:hypothetical protein
MTDALISARRAGVRKLWQNVKAVASADLIAELRAINTKIDALDQYVKAVASADLIAELRAINTKIDALDQHGARAVYVGNNRVLMRTTVAGAQIAFLLEANDRLLHHGSS